MRNLCIIVFLFLFALLAFAIEGMWMSGFYFGLALSLSVFEISESVERRARANRVAEGK